MVKKTNKPDVVEGVIRVTLPKINLRPSGEIELIQIEKEGVCIGLTIAQAQSLAKYIEEKLPL